MLRVLIESLLLAASLSTDLFVAFSVYGTRNIHVPKRSAAAAVCVCTGVFALFALFGNALSPFISNEAAKIVGFTVLFFIGLLRLFDALIKSAIRRGSAQKSIRWKAMGLHFLLEVYADPEYADVDKGGILSVSEAIPLSLAMSVDGAAAGFSSGTAHNVAAATLLSLFLCVAAVCLGLRFGRYIAGKSTIDISPFGGVILIGLAVARLVG